MSGIDESTYYGHCEPCDRDISVAVERKTHAAQGQSWVRVRCAKCGDVTLAKRESDVDPRLLRSDIEYFVEPDEAVFFGGDPA